MTAGDRQWIPAPVVRNLRIFAVDPGITAGFETAVPNEMTVRIPWEELDPGPVGEYVAVVEEEEGREGIDLDRLDLLSQNGLPPSDGNPQFRQQMVYAVAMATIKNFERALGRRAHWAPSDGAYQSRLKLYPHGLSEDDDHGWGVDTAHYFPGDGIRFGYFESGSTGLFPGTVVFTCLSQDVIAHEVTHALLAGMSIDFASGTNPDGPALNEAFSDLVALFQHFGKSDVLREQIGAVQGNLEKRSPLGAVALQLGQSLGLPAGVRNALGYVDEHGEWQPRAPDPRLYPTVTEAHDLGDILVGAVFDAFKKIYESRIADLRRLATKGTGVLGAGRLHPDLVARLAAEASEAAGHVLVMCIRALDYCPPVDITFGDFLRAIVTADYDAFPNDVRNYRIAFADAFRRSGILPTDVGTLSVDTFIWPRATDDDGIAAVTSYAQEMAGERVHWNLPSEREELWSALETRKTGLTEHLAGSGATRLGVIDLTRPFDVRSFHLRQRAGLGGSLAVYWVLKIVQKWEGAGDVMAGCTLLLDAETGRVRYQIEKAPSGAAAPAARGRALFGRTDTVHAPPPTVRSLRVFAFDPSLGVQLETAGINEVTLQVPWERDANGKDLLAPGPVGEYLEVIDRDPASGCYYAPVDLNDSQILAQDGLPPSESNPQFHQQMVYAVAMRTIRNFERALGRLALWSPRHYRDEKKQWHDDYVPRLRVHPHALREANAYYSPAKKALLFGYFPALVGEGGDPDTDDRVNVFTCLSHDIVAHEVTHALLDGIHRRFSEASNPDVLAFHEAFADLVALFQHFSLPGVLRHQIAATRGDLESQNQLGELAQQFGQAIGKRGALRSAIGEVDDTGRWTRKQPDPEAYQRETEPHARGSLLVAAVFDAFLTIYKSRVADLLRIATEGTGVLPAGHLHPDLVNRLADEAAESADEVLQMCIRALDYCPPVDITFGDYLRALVTADFEFDPIDDRRRRVAFAEAFRRYGIVPEGVRTLSVDGLLWRPTSDAPDEDEKVSIGLVQDWASDIGSWDLSRSREELFRLSKKKAVELHEYLERTLEDALQVLSAIDLTLSRTFEVHSLRPSVRTDWNGQPRSQWVIELTQRIEQFDDPDDAEKPGATPDYYFRGGCTLVVDAETGKVRYSIKKRLDAARRERQRTFHADIGNRSLAATYFSSVAHEIGEPFAMVHRL